MPPSQYYPSQHYAHSSTGHYPAPNNSSSCYDRSPSGRPDSYRDPRAHGTPAVNWTDYRRRDSTDSAWSSHSSSSGTSLQSRQASSTNALQFQPLPNSQVPPSTNSHQGVAQAQTDYQSPFGVLIADVNPNGASDPQRAALFRSLRSSGAQGFQINFDDGRSSQNNRYICPVCNKGFSRPSSLRVS